MKTCKHILIVFMGIVVRKSRIILIFTQTSSDIVMHKSMNIHDGSVGNFRPTGSLVSL